MILLILSLGRGIKQDEKFAAAWKRGKERAVFFLDKKWHVKHILAIKTGYKSSSFYRGKMRNLP